MEYPHPISSEDRDRHLSFAQSSTNVVPKPTYRRYASQQVMSQPPHEQRHMGQQHSEEGPIPEHRLRVDSNNASPNRQAPGSPSLGPRAAQRLSGSDYAGIGRSPSLNGEAILKATHTLFSHNDKI